MCRFSLLSFCMKLASVLLVACGPQESAILSTPEETEEMSGSNEVISPDYVVVYEEEAVFSSRKEEDTFISASKAQEIVWETYPDLDFGEDVMFGPERVAGVWIDGYMLSAVDGDDIFEVIVDARTGEIVKEVVLHGYGAKASACYVYPVVFGVWYSQNDNDWDDELLGNHSSDTIGDYGCVISSLAMTYENVWSTPTTPLELNDSAVSAGCFGAGSSLVNVSCAINSRGGPHGVSDLSMSSVATAICGGYPVMVDVTWGGGHKMLAYYYSGGSTSSKGSYKVVDPWYDPATSKTLSAYTVTRWRKLY